MRISRLKSSVILCLSVSAASVGLAAAAASCGSSGNQQLPELDASGDHTTDVSTDSPNPGDAMGDDAADSSDSGNNGDAPGEAGDDGGGEAAACPVSVPSSLPDFVNALANTVCQHLQTCCGLSSSQFNMASCVSIYSNPSFGGWMGVAGVSPYFDGGAITYDTTAACQCLQGTSAIACGNVPSAQWNSLQNSCLGAAQGTAAVGGACTSSYECAPSAEYCSAGDGGTGACANLVPSGGPCQTNSDCSYLGNGNPPLYCDSATHTCVPRLVNGTACSLNAMCQSNICFYTGNAQQCVDSVAFSDPMKANGKCEYFTIADAGATDAGATDAGAD